MKIEIVPLVCLTSSERESLLVRYRKLYSLIYGKTMTDRLLDLFNTHNEFISSFSKNYQKAEFVLNDIYNINSDMFLLYDDNDELSMAGRITKEDNFLYISEVVLFKKDPQINASLYQYLLSYLKDISKENGTIKIKILNINIILENVVKEDDFHVTYHEEGEEKSTWVLERKNNHGN